MLSWLWLIPTLPFAGFFVLALAGGRLPKSGVAWIGAGSVGGSAIVAALVGASFIHSPPAGYAFTQTCWTWIHVGDLQPGVAFYLDALAVVMMLVVTWVGFLIHLYSTRFMFEEEGYSRYFAYMNLFVGSMLTLVLADNLLLLYLGWEGVGLCSYLLIGFWYQDPANGRAARKAFIVTRVGDTAMAIGLFLLFTHLGTFQIQELMRRAAEQWPVGSGLAIAAAALLLGGAVGKSAQLPLQTWLPDAMAGPTPVSALIHAATMVTAGVYLIARTHVLFALAPPVQSAVAIIGAATLLLSGFSAVTQRDIKRVLAYSTISQIGYMFLALGVGAWSAGIYHFLSHALFKSLLFLGAGVIILGLHHEHDMFRMGGLRKALPLTFWVFFIASLALAGLPPTDGFASKDLILYRAWSSRIGGPWLWGAGLLGVFLTGLYTFRMVFLTFFGPRQQEPEKKADLRMNLPLVVLAVFCLLAAVLNWPESLGGSPWLTRFLEHALPPAPVTHGTVATEGTLEGISVATSLLGVLAAWLLTRGAPAFVRNLQRAAVAGALHSFWFSGWAFDWFYDRAFVRPFVWCTRVNRNDFVDFVYRAIAFVVEGFHYLACWTQTGRVRWYAMGIALGALLITGLVIFL